MGRDMAGPTGSADRGQQLSRLRTGREISRTMMTPRFSCVVGEVGGDGWPLCLTRGRQDEGALNRCATEG